MDQWRQTEANELMNSVANGSIAAFESFYDRYSPLVFRVALKTVGQRMDAEDVCQEVFMEVIGCRSRFDASRGSIESWLAVLTRSRALDLLRKVRRRAEIVQDRMAENGWVYQGSNPEETAIYRMNNQALYEAVLQLPMGQREVVIGKISERYSQRDMARRLQQPLGTVKSRFRYALSNLRRYLTAAGWEDGEGGERSDAGS